MMIESEIIKIVVAHPVVSAILGFAVFNAAVQAMEKPTASDGRLYRYVFRLAHGLAFNFKYALRSKFPEYVPDQEEKEEP